MELFVDREQEMQTLKQEYARKSSSLVVLYGGWSSSTAICSSRRSAGWAATSPSSRPSPQATARAVRHRIRPGDKGYEPDKVPQVIDRPGHPGAGSPHHRGKPGKEQAGSVPNQGQLYPLLVCPRLPQPQLHRERPQRHRPEQDPQQSREEPHCLRLRGCLPGAYVGAERRGRMALQLLQAGSVLGFQHRDRHRRPGPRRQQPDPGRVQILAGARRHQCPPDLEEKAKTVSWMREQRKTWFVLFGCNGFTEELRDIAAERENMLFFDDL